MISHWTVVILPNDCETSEWQRWVVTGQDGSQLIGRSRVVVVEPDVGGAQCPHLSEQINCGASGNSDADAATCASVFASSTESIWEQSWFLPAAGGVLFLLLLVIILSFVVLRQRRFT